VIATLAVLVPSVLLAPRAWADFIHVFPNLLAGDSVYPTNLAPASMIALAVPDAPLAATVVRVGVIGLGIALIAASVLLARRPNGWAAAVTCGVAAVLIIPSATWFHYLAVLLPLAAFAWPRARARARLAIFGGALLVSLAIAWLPLAVVGGVILVSGVLHTVWPRQEPA